jgi:hypothetical protein
MSNSSSPLPQLILLPSANTKNHKRKIRMINENGCVCARCYNVFEVEELTLDHVCPKFICSKEYYNTRGNWQLLCRTCHRLKSKIEHSFIVRISQKIIENIHMNNKTVIDISELIQEFKELFQTVLNVMQKPQ